MYLDTPIGDIIKEWGAINLGLLIETSKKNRRYVLRELRELKKQRKIIEIKRGRYAIYLFNSKRNPFINIFYHWDIEKPIRTRVMIYKGWNYRNRRSAKLEERNNKIKLTPKQLRLREYVRKMFLSEKPKFSTIIK